MDLGHGNAVYGLCKNPEYLYIGNSRFKRPGSLVIYDLPEYKDVPTVKGKSDRIAVIQDGESYTMYEYHNGLVTGYIPTVTGLQKTYGAEPFINTERGVNNMRIIAKLITKKGSDNSKVYDGEIMYIFSPNGDIENGKFYAFVMVYVDLYKRPYRMMMGYIVFMDEDDIPGMLPSDPYNNSNVMYAKVKKENQGNTYDIIGWNEYDSRYSLIGRLEVQR